MMGSLSSYDPWPIGHIDWLQLASIAHSVSSVSENEEHEEELVPNGRHDEEVDGDDLLQVVLEEGAPGRGGWLPAADHVLLDGRLRHIDPGLLQLSHDAGCSTERVRRRHPADQVADLSRSGWPPRFPASAQLRPVLAELPCNLD